MTSKFVCLLSSLALMAAACTSGGEPSATEAAPEADPAAQAEALPLDQQHITVGTLADDFRYGESDRPSLGKYPLNTSVFDTLVRLNEDLQVEPMLAERWDHDVEANTYTFHLRRGVLFHDGSELTAEDVKYTFELIARASPTNYQQLGPDSVTVVDDHTVQIVPVTHNNRLVEQLVHPHFGINRKDSYSDPLHPMGTGPYRFVEYVPNDRFVVERFDDYWNPDGAARAQRITFRFVGDAQTRIIALRSGDLDLIMDVPREAAAELAGTPGLRVTKSEVGAYNAFNFNIAGQAPHDIAADPLVREAIAAAVDRKAVLERVWAGNAEESTTWIPPQVLGEHADLVEAVSYDPERAEELLEQAGWVPGADGIREKDGRRLSLVHLIGGPGDSDPQDSVAAAEFIQAQLRAVGVDTQIETPEAATASERQSTGQYDIFQSVGNQNEGNPCFLPDLIYYSGGGSASAEFRAPGGRTDEAIEGCRAAPDVDGARRFAAEAIRELVSEEHVVVPLIGLYRIWAMTDAVAGFTPHPSLTNQRWEGVYLTQ